MTPDFANLILTFKADTSFIIHSAAAGTLHPAVWRDFLLHCGLPLADHKFFCNTGIDEISWEHFIQRAFPHCVKIRIHSDLFKRFDPSVVVKKFGPCVKDTSVFISF